MGSPLPYLYQDVGHGQEQATAESAVRGPSEKKGVSWGSSHPSHRDGEQVKNRRAQVMNIHSRIFVFNIEHTF